MVRIDGRVYIKGEAKEMAKEGYSLGFTISELLKKADSLGINTLDYEKRREVVRAAEEGFKEGEPRYRLRF